MQEEKLNTLFGHIISNEAKKTVGMTLKRIEIFVDQAKKENRDYLTFKELELVKSSIKEVLYEQFRNVIDFIKTGKVIFEIINPKSEGKNDTGK